MRIIGGNLKGKKIIDPIDKSTRPLKDVVRESIFNIIEHSNNEFVKLKGAKILDLFSGTGSFGIECLSRGADKVVFFENYSPSIKILKQNISALDLNKKSKIIFENSYSINKTNIFYKNFDLVFLDPPFKDDNINTLLNEIIKLKIVDKNSIIIIHRNKKNIEKFSDKLKIIREKKYGLSKIIFGKIY